MQTKRGHKQIEQRTVRETATQETDRAARSKPHPGKGDIQHRGQRDYERETYRDTNPHYAQGNLPRR